MPNLSLLQHVKNNRPQAWAWGKKDTSEWCSAFRLLVDGNNDKILSDMINDSDFVQHAAPRFEYWSTIIHAQRHDIFTKFLQELSQRPYRSNVLIGEIMLYTVKHHSNNLAVEFIQSNCVVPAQLQEFHMLAHVVNHSSADKGADVFTAVWRKGGASVQGVKSINPAVMKLMGKEISEWNPSVVATLLAKINSARLRKYFVGQPTYITDRLEHLIALREEQLLSKIPKLNPTLHPPRKI